MISDPENCLLLSLPVQDKIPNNIYNGEYINVINSSDNEFIFTPFYNNDGRTINEKVDEAIQTYLDEDCSIERQRLILYTGISSLYIFVQSNWTGPQINFNQIHFIKKVYNWDDLHSVSINSLQLDGEAPICGHKLILPFFFSLARAILIFSARQLKDCISLPWWSMRCSFMFRQLLPLPVHTLQHHCSRMIDQAFTNFPKTENRFSEMINAKLLLEASIVCKSLLLPEDAVKYFEKAQNITGLKYDFSGEYGKRTKFQIEEKIQLLAIIESNEDFNSFFRSMYSNDILFHEQPKSIELNSDTLLEHVKFTKDQSLSVLCPFDSSIIAAFCDLLKTDNPVGDHLISNKIFALIENILMSSEKYGLFWSTKYYLLYIRALLEHNDNYYFTRAINQLEQLTSEFNDNKIPVSIRMNGFFCINFPSYFNLRRSLGHIYEQASLFKSALSCYESFDDYEKTIELYIKTNRPEDAKILIEKRITIDPHNPRLACFLADVFEEKERDEQYLRAWELSKNTLALAQRKLGNRARRRKEWQKSIDHYQLALQINPLFVDIWFSVGYAALQIKNYEIGASSFSRVVQLEPNHAEGWNNLAAIHLNTKKYDLALHALTQASKHLRQSKGIWQNLLTASIHLGKYSKSIEAIDHIIDLDDISNIDENLISLLNSNIIELNNSRTCKEMERILYKFIEKKTSGILWYELAKISISCGNYESAGKSLQSYVRYIRNGIWCNNVEQFSLLVQALTRRTEFHREHFPECLFECSLDIDSIISQAKQSMSLTGHVGISELENLLETINKILDN